MNTRPNQKKRDCTKRSEARAQTGPSPFSGFRAINSTKTHSRSNGVRGFTLIEVLVALSILIIGIISTMQLFPFSLLQARQAAERTITSQVATSVFGQIRASTAQALLLGKIPESLMQVDRAGGLYGYETSVQSMGGAEEVHLQRITIIMNFADEREESYVTYVAKQ